jgi:glycine betaine catabolism A
MLAEMPATTLPQRYYTDAELFRAEIERFFFDRWICVGRAEQLARPGDYVVAEVADESVIVTRDLQGNLRAFYNVCRHRGTRLCVEAEGSFAGRRIVCPYHAWTYGLDGELLGAPQMDEDFSRADYPLHAVRVDAWEGHVFVHLGEAAQPLAEQLVPLTERFAPWQMALLERHRQIVYDVRANWKLIVANYNECLHCPVLHPTLNRLTDALDVDNAVPTAAFIGGSMGFKGDAETMSVDGVRRRDYLPGLSNTERKLVHYYAIYPNLLLSLHPDYMMTHRLMPRAVDRTEIVCEWHFHPAEIAKPDFQSADAVDFWDRTNCEDWHISELSQSGIRSRAYRPGPYSKREGLLQAFDRVVAGDDGVGNS